MNKIAKPKTKSSLLGTCIVCLKRCASRCSTCKIVFYCSVACQRKDIEKHHSECHVDIEDTLKYLRLQSRACACDECKLCCTRQPGAYDPTHLHLLTLQDPSLFSQITQDKVFVNDCLEPIFYLRPKQNNELGGTRSSMLPVHSACSFLGPQGCTLRRDNMPLGCAVVLACHQRVMQVDKDQVAVVWTTDIAKRVMLAFESFNHQRGVVSLGIDQLYKDLSTQLVSLCDKSKTSTNLKIPACFYKPF